MITLKKLATSKIDKVTHLPLSLSGSTKRRAIESLYFFVKTLSCLGEIEISSVSLAIYTSSAYESGNDSTVKDLYSIGDKNLGAFYSRDRCPCVPARILSALVENWAVANRATS